MINREIPWCDACQSYHHDAAYCIKAKGDLLRKYVGANVAAHWPDVDYTQTELRLLQHAQQDVDRHYQIAYEAWERQRTKPETRWEFADRMAKQEG